MGYFKRKLDRKRCGDLAQGFHERLLSDETWVPWEGEAWSEQHRPCFLRFSIPETHWLSRRRTGVFSAAYSLRREKSLDDEIAARLTETLEWFGENLASPDFDEERAIFFFKSDHPECSRRIWDMAWVLREAGRHVELQRVDRPGRIVYEDAHQVAAIPWSENESL